MTDNFSRQVTVSAIFHFFIFGLIFIRAAVLPQEHFEVRDAIRVDVVGLPQKMQALPEPEAAPAPPAPKELPKKETPPVAKTVAPVVEKPVAKPINTAKAQKSALDKLKALDALDKIKQEVGKAKAQTNKPKAGPVAGNQVAVGNSLTGLEKIEFDRYFDELKTKIHSQFSQPQFLEGAELQAQVLVLIDERGYVVKKIMRKSSGNGIFDAAVMEAIDSSSPLPVPPSRLRGLLSTSGITFNFPQ